MTISFTLNYSCIAHYLYTRSLKKLTVYLESFQQYRLKLDKINY